VLVIVLAVTFVALGIWQYHRNSEKQDKVKAAKAAYAAPAPELSGAANPPSGARAQASGTFSTSDVLLRDQPRNGRFGTDVLTPMLLADGTTVLVDRGWVPGILADEAPSVTPAPAGAAIARGIVNGSRPLSPKDDVRDIGGKLAVPRVDTAAIGQRLGIARLRPVWIEAQSLQPVPGPGAPQLPQPPPPDQVNHMEYALQWWAFALIPLIGWPIVCWQVTRRKANKANEPEQSTQPA
jgi:cytochrome oxidase assembly protein ShyY1